MKRNLLILIVLALVASGCSIRPSGVLSKRKMQALLVDLHKTDGVVAVKGYNYGHDYDVEACYAYTLEKHGVTQAQFDSSLVWYTDHPLLFNRVYPKVLEQLKAEKEYYEQMSEEMIEKRAAARSRQKNQDWKKWIDEHTRPMDISLWKDTFETEKMPSTYEKVLFFEKNY